MSKKSVIMRNEKRVKLSARYREKRSALRSSVRKKDSTLSDRLNAVMALAKLPRDSSFVRVRVRCSITGRGRGNYRKLGISRIMLRKLAGFGLISGVIKSSW